MIRLLEKCFIRVLVLTSVLPVSSAIAQSDFYYSRVVFESHDRVDLEAARRDYDGNVFIYFYARDHADHITADSLFLSNERISSLLNERYLRSAIDLESSYAKIFLSQVEVGGPTDVPFILLLNLDRPAHQGMWRSWGYEHPLPGVDEMVLDQTFWKLSNFADYGTTTP